MDPVGATPNHALRKAAAMTLYGVRSKQLIVLPSAALAALSGPHPGRNLHVETDDRLKLGSLYLS